jgi:hypothetical protein
MTEPSDKPVDRAWAEAHGLIWKEPDPSKTTIVFQVPKDPPPEDKPPKK